MRCSFCNDPGHYGFQCAQSQMTGRSAMALAETVQPEESKEALRFNAGKLPFSWFPKEGVVAFTSVLWKSSIPGGGKYPAHNWKKGAKWSVPLDCALRHLYAFMGGEFYDPIEKGGTGLPHAWHALVNLVFLVYYMARYPEMNDLAVSSEEKKE
jgi:hypothetical protein